MFQCVKKVCLFEPTKPKNRRFTTQEFETELQIAKWLKRPVRTFVNDPPFYPWVVPEPLVNFDLNFNKGQH